MAGWSGVRHRAAAPAVRLGGASGWKGGECEAQGGCACCAVRVEQWSGGLLMRWLDIRKGNNDY